MNTRFAKVAFVFFLAGLFLFLYDIQGVCQGYRSTTWPTTSGEIIASRIETTSVKRGSRHSHYYHSPLIVYSYKVEGVHYSGNRIEPGRQVSGHRQYVENIVEAYPIGTAVNVYYNPDAPTLSFLKPGISTSTYLLTGAGCLFLSVAFVLVTLGICFSPDNLRIIPTEQSLAEQPRRSLPLHIASLDKQRIQRNQMQSSPFLMLILLGLWILCVLLVGVAIIMILR
jgi:hypothetical protein